MQKKNIKLEEIISLYNNYGNASIVAEKLNCCTANVCKRLHKAGISTPSSINRRPSSRTKFKINEFFFKDIDTEAKAYFLGLMYADGSVSKNSFYIKLKDEDILQQFKDSLEYEKDIEFRDGYYILSVYRQSMCTDLISQGCLINKTHSIQFPDLKPELIRHFIRGFFDGDGSLILNSQRCHNSLNFTSGSLSFLYQLQDKLKDISLTLGGISKEKNNNVWHLRYGGKQVHIILEWLYSESKFYIKRKYNKYLLSN